MRFVLSGTFGEFSEVREGAHTGIDLAMEEGTTLRTLFDGVVYAIRDYGNQNIGKGVVVKASDGNYHIYGHMSKINVEKGQELNGGDMIGLSGNTGDSTDGHLHFGIQKPSGEFIDPTQYAEPLAAITGDVSPLEIVNAVNTVESGGFWDGIKEFFIGNDQIARYRAEKGEAFWDWLFGKVGDGFVHLWDLFVIYLPDIIGYTTMGAGIFIVISSMMSKGGMLKTLGWYFASFVLAAIILGNV